MTRDDEIQGLCKVARVEDLAGVLIASDLSFDDAKRVLLYVTAWLDMAIDSMTMPDLNVLMGVPAPVVKKIRELIARAVLEARSPLTPLTRTH